MTLRRLPRSPPSRPLQPSPPARPRPPSRRTAGPRSMPCAFRCPKTRRCPRAFGRHQADLGRIAGRRQRALRPAGRRARALARLPSGGHRGHAPCRRRSGRTGAVRASGQQAHRPPCRRCHRRSGRAAISGRAAFRPETRPPKSSTAPSSAPCPTRARSACRAARWSAPFAHCATHPATGAKPAGPGAVEERPGAYPPG
jgi:hypothetical protein